MNVDRNTFFEHAVEVMRASGVPFWVEQGTLLGLIRDNGLISWDHDIDFGVWNEPGVEERLIEALCRSGFTVEKLGPEYGCIHFLKSDSGLKVDVTLYGRSDGNAWTRFLVEVSGWRYLINRAGQLMAADEPLAFLPKMSGSKWINKAGVITARILSRIPRFVRKMFALPLIGLSNRFPCLMRCRWTLPERFLLELTERAHGHVRFPVPADANGYLAFVYGAGWKTPNADWVWWKETGGLVLSPYRRAMGIER